MTNTRDSMPALERPADEAADLRLPAPPGAPRGLDFDNAIRAHEDWKARLQAVIEGRSEERLDPRIVGRDDQCALGQWIRGAGGRQLRGQRRFADLRARHAYFHVCAGRILTLALTGQKEAAVTEIGPTGEFCRVSRDVAADLAAVLVRLGGAQA